MSPGTKANKSGSKLEDKLQRFLNKIEFTYIKEKSGSKMIDFQIETEDGLMYVDCTNQNSGGSVHDKIPQKARKYWRQYGYNKVFIVKGKKKIAKEILKTLKEDYQTYGYETIIYSFDEICNVLEGKKVRGDLDKFLIL